MIDVIDFPLTTCWFELALTIPLKLQTNRLSEWADIFGRTLESYIKIMDKDKLQSGNFLSIQNILKH